MLKSKNLCGFVIPTLKVSVTNSQGFFDLSYFYFIKLISEALLWVYCAAPDLGQTKNTRQISYFLAKICWTRKTSTTPSGKNCISFNFQYFWMPLKVIKTLNENSTKCYGPNRIIIGSFQHGFIELAHKGNFCWIF